MCFEKRLNCIKSICYAYTLLMYNLMLIINSNKKQKKLIAHRQNHFEVSWNMNNIYDFSNFSFAHVAFVFNANSSISLSNRTSKRKTFAQRMSSSRTSNTLSRFSRHQIAFAQFMFRSNTFSFNNNRKSFSNLFSIQEIDNQTRAQRLRVMRSQILTLKQQKKKLNWLKDWSN